MTSRTLQKPRNRVREIEGRWTRGESRRATASACSSVHWAKRREVGLGFKEIWPAGQISLMQATRTEFCQSRARRSWGSRRTQRSRHLRPLCRLPRHPCRRTPSCGASGRRDHRKPRLGVGCSVCLLLGLQRCGGVVDALGGTIRQRSGTKSQHGKHTCSGGLECFKSDAFPGYSRENHTFSALFIELLVGS